MYKATKLNRNRAIARIALFTIIGVVLFWLHYIVEENQDCFLLGSYIFWGIAIFHGNFLVSILRRMEK